MTLTHTQKGDILKLLKGDITKLLVQIAYFTGKAGLPAVYNNPLKQKFKATVFVMGGYLAF